MMGTFGPWNKPAVIFIPLFLYGCSLSKPSNTPGMASSSVPAKESMKETETALTSVVQAISGQEVQRKDLENLARRAEKDPETKSAIETIGNSYMGKSIIKYCPLTGKRYSASLENCPEHGVPLKILEE